MMGTSRLQVRHCITTKLVTRSDGSEAALAAVNDYKLYRKKMDSRR